MNDHDRLVNSLVSALQKEGYTISSAALQGYSQPHKIGRHEPDIIGKDPNGLVILGEAKTSDDIDTERSREQYLDFSNRIMSDGLLKGRQVPLHIIVSRQDSPILRQVLIDLGLSYKIGNQITIWVNN